MEIPVIVALAAALFLAFPSDQLCPDEIITLRRQKRKAPVKENFTFTRRVSAWGQFHQHSTECFTDLGKLNFPMVVWF